jgi:hypothetical protein
VKRTLLGSLDSRFFGIKIAYDSIDDFKFSTQVYSRDLDSSKLVEMRLGGLISDRHLWLTTTVEHELRHYHDSLISAHWLGIQSLRNQAAMNTQSMQAVLARFVGEQGANCLAFPLRKWLQLGTSERKMRVDAWPRDEADIIWRPVPLPLYPLPASPPTTFWPDVTDDLRDEAEQLAGLIFVCTMGHDRIDKLNAGRTAGDWSAFRPSHVYEISALIAQLYAAHVTFDEQAAHDLRRSIQSHGMRDYGGHFNYVLTFLLACNGIGWSNVVHVANSLATWAMLGPPDRTEDLQGRPRDEREMVMSCPAARLAFALDVVRARGLPAEAPAELFDILDQEAGTTDHRSAMAWVDTMVETRSRAYAKLAEQTGRRDVIAISKHFEIYKAERGKLRQVLRDDLAAYADPARYMMEIARFPRPVIRIDFVSDAPIMRYEGDPSYALSSGVFDLEQDPSGSNVVKAYIGDQPRDIDLQVLYEYENLQVFTDALLTGKVPAEQFSAVKRLFKGTGVTLFRA